MLLPQYRQLRSILVEPLPDLDLIELRDDVAMADDVSRFDPEPLDAAASERAFAIRAIGADRRECRAR
jgi:hypothetical protein